MKRTPALVAAAAALGLLSGLGLEARASALDSEVSPHMVSVAWLAPGAPSPAGLETEGPGGVVPRSHERLKQLPAMRARPLRKVTEEMRQANRKVLVRGGACPNAGAAQAEPAAFEMRRS